MRRGVLPARVAFALSAALLALLTVATVPASATAYRYWAFWSLTGTSAGAGSWSYQQQGPNTYVPVDGSVDGWRFGVSQDSAHALRPRPSVAPSFAALCANTPAVSGKKRVAVVIDPGDAAGAPAERGACAVLDPQATSAQLLAQVAPPLRYDVNGILCAISGYPAQGCGEAVADPSAAPAPVAAAPTSGSSTPVLGWVAGGALVALLGSAAWWQNRRRRQAN